MKMHFTYDPRDSWEDEHQTQQADTIEAEGAQNATWMWTPAGWRMTVEVFQDDAGRMFQWHVDNGFEGVIVSFDP